MRRQLNLTELSDGPIDTTPDGPGDGGNDWKGDAINSLNAAVNSLRRNTTMDPASREKKIRDILSLIRELATGETEKSESRRQSIGTGRPLTEVSYERGLARFRGDTSLTESKYQTSLRRLRGAPGIARPPLAVLESPNRPSAG